MVRLATPQDLHYFYDLYMHPAINPYLLYEPMSVESFVPIYKDLTDKNALFVYSAAGRDIGMFKLLPQQYRNAHIVYLGGVALHPDYFGSGHARLMMEEIVSLARDKGFLRIELSVASTNAKAMRLYESVGFEKEGILRKYTCLARENKYIDEVFMAWLSPD